MAFSKTNNPSKHYKSFVEVAKHKIINGFCFIPVFIKLQFQLQYVISETFISFKKK